MTETVQNKPQKFCKIRNMNMYLQIWPNFLTIIECKQHSSHIAIRDIKWKKTESHDYINSAKCSKDFSCLLCKNLQNKNWLKEHARDHYRESKGTYFSFLENVWRRIVNGEERERQRPPQLVQQMTNCQKITSDLGLSKYFSQRVSLQGRLWGILHSKPFIPGA